ncbi:MAG: cyclase family protein [Roseococcus sp.]|nr:cyclase family protein [Roseococcus sp.]
MRLIDLSRTITHRLPRLPNHPSIEVFPFSTHAEKRMAEGYAFSSATLVLHMGDHAGTHVDAPVHFDERPGAMTVDQMPLERFFTEAICLDLSHKPPRSDITIADLEEAVAKAGAPIRPGDTVLLHMAHHARSWGSEAWLTDFPGLTKESAHWLCDQGIGMFGVEAVSPGRPGRHNFEVHHVCRDRGITHMEGLCNLEALVGQGRFRFIGFPLKIAGGTGSPIRAVAWLDR